MMATTNHFELTPYIQNNSINFDYDITHDPYKGVYHAYIFLVTYGENNHTDDVSAETIMAPTDNSLYLRYNPTSGEPIIVIKNIGSNTLTSVEVKYGFKNGTQYSYQWKGNLPFLKMDTIILPLPDWDEIANAEEKIFQFELFNPNGKTDPTPYNNKQASSFQMPILLTTSFIQFVFKTNHAPKETSWKLYNMNGDILYQSQPSMNANTEYIKNMELKDGSYKLHIYDTGDDGLAFFSETSGSAVLKKRLSNGLYTSFYQFNPNFGREVQLYFAINKYIDTLILNNVVKFVQDLIIFPNPVQSTIYVEMSNLHGKDNMTANIYDMFGKHIMSKEMNALQLNEINVDHLATGVYVITIQENGKLIGRNKFVISE
jgi:hypothetical protein